MSVLRIPVAVGFLILQLNPAFAQAVQNDEPASAASVLTGTNIDKLALRLYGVPAVPIAEISRELDRRGVGIILGRPYDQMKIDRAREVILDLYRGLATGPIDVASYARKVPSGSAEVVFVIRSKAERAGNSN